MKCYILNKDDKTTEKFSGSLYAKYFGPSGMLPSALPIGKKLIPG
jgi:uncharacterized membrane protein YgdD (TMEM256/DUF423 family)